MRVTAGNVRGVSKALSMIIVGSMQSCSRVKNVYVFVVGINVGVPVVSLNRLSVGCGTTPRRQSGYLLRRRLLFVYPRDLYNAATSRTLVNPAVIYIIIHKCKFVFLFILC